MAITITVGTNSYISLADSDTYFESFGDLDWESYDDETKKQALVLATQSVDLLYGERYRSYVASDTQALLFPRMSFTDANGRQVTGTPTCLLNAVCEIAKLYINGTDIFPVATTTSNTRSESIQVGGISISSDNFGKTEGESFEGFRKVDILLRPILKDKIIANWRIKA